MRCHRNSCKMEPTGYGLWAELTEQLIVQHYSDGRGGVVGTAPILCSLSCQIYFMQVVQWNYHGGYFVIKEGNENPFPHPRDYFISFVAVSLR